MNTDKKTENTISQLRLIFSGKANELPEKLRSEFFSVRPSDWSRELISALEKILK